MRVDVQCATRRQGVARPHFQPFPLQPHPISSRSNENLPRTRRIILFTIKISLHAPLALLVPIRWKVDCARNVESGGKKESLYGKDRKATAAPRLCQPSPPFHDRTRHGNVKARQRQRQREREVTAHAGSLTSYPFKIGRFSRLAEERDISSIQRSRRRRRRRRKWIVPS